jgi:hypothetical protein
MKSVCQTARPMRGQMPWKRPKKKNKRGRERWVVSNGWKRPKMIKQNGDTKGGDVEGKTHKTHNKRREK